MGNLESRKIHQGERMGPSAMTMGLAGQRANGRGRISVFTRSRRGGRRFSTVASTPACLCPGGGPAHATDRPVEGNFAPQAGRTPQLSSFGRNPGEVVVLVNYLLSSEV